MSSASVKSATSKKTPKDAVKLVSKSKKKNGPSQPPSPAPVLQTQARYKQLLAQGVSRHQILSSWLEELKDQDEESEPVKQMVAKILDLLPPEKAVLTQPAVRRILDIPRQVHFVYVIWSNTDAEVMAEYDPLDAFATEDDDADDDGADDGDEDSADDGDDDGADDGDEDGADDGDDDGADDGDEDGDDDSDDDYEEDVVPDVKWTRLYTSDERDDHFVVCKVGMFTADIDELEYSYSRDTHRVSLTGNYQTTTARHTIAQKDVSFKLPSGKEMVMALLDQFAQKNTRPRAITRKLHRLGIGDAQFLMFAIDPWATHSAVLPSRVVAAALECNLRNALSAAQSGFAKGVIHGLGMDGTADGPTEWILSSSALMQEVTTLHQGSHWITAQDVKQLKDSEAAKQAVKGLRKLEDCLDLDQDLLIVWIGDQGEEEIGIKWA